MIQMLKKYVILLALCIGKSFSMQEGDNDRLLKGVWDLYQEFCNQTHILMTNIEKKHRNNQNFYLSNFEDSTSYCKYDIKQHKEKMGNHKYPEILKKLTIDLPLEKIEKIFKETGVIQLRKIKDNSHKLLLGCGNDHITADNIDQIHTHKNMTTISLELSHNPTFVGAFGVNDFSKLLPKNRYDAIALEYLQNFRKTEEMLKAFNGEYLKESYKIYYVREEKREEHDRRGKIALDQNGEDQLNEIEKKKWIYENSTAEAWGMIQNNINIGSFSIHSKNFPNIPIFNIEIKAWLMLEFVISLGSNQKNWEEEANHFMKANLPIRPENKDLKDLLEESLNYHLNVLEEHLPDILKKSHKLHKEIDFHIDGDEKTTKAKVLFCGKKMREYAGKIFKNSDK